MTALEQARDYFRSPDSQPLSTDDFAKRFGVCSSAARKSLAILKFEGMVARERQPGNRFVYTKAK